MMVPLVMRDGSATVNNIEEAVFYIGLRQIRELSMATPVIEDFEKLQRPGLQLAWKDLWKHSVGTAIMTREILATTHLLVDDDTDYIIGLLHNVGKEVMAYAFPKQFQQIVSTPAGTVLEVCRLERDLIGWDHGQIGGYYLRRHQLSEEIVDAVLYHTEPEKAQNHAFFAAAVQVADTIVRFAGMPGGFEVIDPIHDEAWTELSGWQILYGNGDREARLSRAAIQNSLLRLPGLLAGLV